jgi:S-adenosyl-L-methionine hydrolase (adenosine-forming)
MSGLITLTTDFGQADHFVGAMKGVILSIAPRARIIDITHEIPPYALNEAAFVIAQTWRYFPQGTIHVMVVDPGVGSARRPILAAAGGHYFVAPDNGVLTMIYDAAPAKVREISSASVIGKHVSRTFHGRDVFAPAAAHVARGVPPARFGKLIEDYTRFSPLKPARRARHVWTGSILKVDHFGNLITNFHIDEFPDVKTRPIELRVGLERVRRLALTYAETEIGEVFVIVGSSGYLEVAANQASAAKTLGCGAGAPVELEIF